MLQVHGKYRGVAVDVHVPRTATASDLAAAFSAASPALPPPDRQKLLCRGKQLLADTPVPLSEVAGAQSSLAVLVVEAPPPAPPAPSLTLRYVNGAVLRAFETSAETTVAEATEQAKHALCHHFALGQDALKGSHVLFANGQVLEPSIRLSAYRLPLGAPIYLLPAHRSLGELAFGGDSGMHHAFTQAARVLQQCTIRPLPVENPAASAADAEPGAGAAGAADASPAAPRPPMPAAAAASVPATMRAGLRPPPAAVAPATQPIVTVLLAPSEPTDAACAAGEGSGASDVVPDAACARGLTAAALSAAEAELGRRLETLVGELVRGRCPRPSRAMSEDDGRPPFDLDVFEALGGAAEAALGSVAAPPAVLRAPDDASSSSYYSQLVSRLERAYPTPAPPVAPTHAAESARPPRPPPIRAAEPPSMPAPAPARTAEAAAPQPAAKAAVAATAAAPTTSPTAPTVRGLRRGFLGGRSSRAAAGTSAAGRAHGATDARSPSPKQPTVRGLRRGFLSSQPAAPPSPPPSGGGGGSGSGGARQRSEPRDAPSAPAAAAAAEPHPASTLKRPLERSGEGKGKSGSGPSSPVAKAGRSGPAGGLADGARADGAVPAPTEGRPVCACCNRRLPLVALLTAKCRCGQLHCSAHSEPRAHACTYDYRSAARFALSEKLTAAVPPRSADGMARSS